MARHLALIAAGTLLVGGPLLAAEPVVNPLADSATWEDMRYDIVGDTEIQNGIAVLELDAPARAHDAATVPIVLRQIDEAAAVTKATVVVDENPAPVAAVFDFSPAMGPIDFELRVRVDQYSNVRVLTESDNGLSMSGRFVKASGGCSAPASRDPEMALANLGQMKLRMFGDEPLMSIPRREAQIMIRHPNYSGLQRDQVTHLFIPAHFIDHMEVWQGDDLLFTMDGGISVSENPVFRFSYDDNGAPDLLVKATDTEGNVFENRLSKSMGS